MNRSVRHSTLAAVLFLFAISLTSTLRAQTSPATGTPPFSSTAGGPDVINLGNLNVHWAVPVLNKPGRGQNFTYDLGYDSSIWYPVTSGSTTSWQPVTNLGWLASTAITTGSILRSSTMQYLPCGPKGVNEEVWTYSNYAYNDAFGRSHPFSGTTEWSPSPNCPNTSLKATSTDGSGLLLNVPIQTLFAPAVTVTTPSGKVLIPPLAGGTNTPNTSTDRNGNQITAGSNGVFTDTLGTTALTVTGSGTPSSPIVLTYTPPNTSTSKCASTNTTGVACYTMNYTNYTVATNFGVSGINEYKSSAAVPLVASILLPDGSQYSLTYEPTPTTPASGACTPYSGTTCTTGRLASITLPTGGTISYSYYNSNNNFSACATGNNGIFSDGSTSCLLRTTPDGTWTYLRSQVSGSHWQTKVTTPADSQNQNSIGDDTIVDFQKDGGITQNFYETQRLAYQGSSSSGSLLRTTTICYNTNTTNCPTTTVSSPITQRNLTTILPGSADLQVGSIYKYNSGGSLTEQDDYDYGSGAPGALLKKTAITYSSLGNNINAFRQQVTVTNGSGTTVSQTNYNYDGSSVVATSGTPQHTSVTGSRGNLTSVNYYTAGSTYLTKTMTYFDTGKVQTVTDVNNAQTTYNYYDATSTCGYAFPTSVSEPLSLSKSMTWNCTGGVQLTVTDENNQTTTTAFTDLYFWRPASLTDRANAVTNAAYSSQTQTEASLSFNGGNSATDMLGTNDVLGRTHLSQIRESPGGSNFDTIETDYDTFGRPNRVTLPYVGTAGQTNSTAPARSTSYDALGRTLKISDNSTGYRSFSYSSKDTYITRGPAPTGENTKRRQEEYDGLGRLTSVCEITSASDGGTCSQNSAQTGYWTKYTYDALGRLTGMTQNAQAASASQQSRSFSYDLMGRLTSETHPESGTTTYVYDTDSTCGTSNGDRVKKTDAVGNVTCIVYDSLHRPTAITYPSGSYASVTPAKHFVYDSATVNSVAMTNVKGRLAEAYTCTGSCTTKITDEGFSYTVRGEPSDVYQSTPNSGGYYHVNATYWASSALKQMTAPGLPTINYIPDGEGRHYQVSASSGQNPVTNTVFSAASLPTSVTYGSGDSDAFSYDSNTNRITQYQFAVNGQSLTGVLTWNADHTLASQNITDAFNSTDTQNCSYTHDDLTRLASINCGSIWSQTFTYDAFGNLSKSGTSSFQPIYKNTNGYTSNRYVSIPGTTVSYDANGNVLADGSHTYSMDSAGKAVTADSVNLTYDALGRMVEQNRSGSYTQIVYSPAGAKLALMNGQTLQKGFVPLPGGVVAVYNASGLLYYGHSDHLGSIKLGSTPSRTVYFDLAYAPFGEIYATSGTTDPAFTGQRQDTSPGLFDFPDREYGTQGRWPAPDPAGAGSMILADPQTLNRYAYVRNSPLVMIDPTGLQGIPAFILPMLCEPGMQIISNPTCLTTMLEENWNNLDPTSGGDYQNSSSDCTDPNNATCGDNQGNNNGGTNCNNAQSPTGCATYDCNLMDANCSVNPGNCIDAGGNQIACSNPQCQDVNGEPSACGNDPSAYAEDVTFALDNSPIADQSMINAGSQLQAPPPIDCSAFASDYAGDALTYDDVAAGILGALIGMATGDGPKAGGKGFGTGIAGALMWKGMKYSAAMQTCQISQGFILFPDM